VCGRSNGKGQEGMRCGYMGVKRLKDTHLLLMVKALVVVLKDGCAFCLARVVLGVCVGRVACEDFLPEGEAAGWAWVIVLADVL